MNIVDIITGIALFILAVIDWKEKKIPVVLVGVWSGLLFIIRRATRTRKALLSECSLNREWMTPLFYLRSNANTKKACIDMLENI